MADRPGRPVSSCPTQHSSELDRGSHVEFRSNQGCSDLECVGSLLTPSVIDVRHGTSQVSLEEERSDRTRLNVGDETNSPIA